MKTLSIVGLILLSVTGYSQDKKPLVVVNGMAVSPESEFANSIPIDEIVSLTTYQREEAISRYGELLGNDGVVEIKTRFSKGQPWGVPDEHRLIYGDGKPVVVVDGKVIEYERLKEISTSEIISIGVNKNVEDVNDWGLQAINGTITVSIRHD